MELQKPCSNFCKVKGSDKKCIRKCKLEDLVKARQQFWGMQTDPSPNRAMRTNSVKKILKDVFDNSSKTFKYRIGDQTVCEHAHF